MSDERTIYYLGNKARTAQVIVDICIDSFGSNGPAFDVFAGSGSVSRVFSRKMSVITNDIQVFSWILCSALFRSTIGDRTSLLRLMDKDKLERMASAIAQQFHNEIELEAKLLENALKEDQSTEERRVELSSYLFEKIEKGAPIVSIFGGVYFSIQNACELQALADFALGLPEAERMILEAGLLTAASRSSFTVGNQFAQPLKLSNKDGATKNHAVLKYLRATRQSPIKTAFSVFPLYPEEQKISENNICVRQDDLSAIKNYGAKAGFLYLDPPYGREHYSRYYHVLESIVTRNYDSIKNTLTRMRENRFQSPYGIRSQAEEAFKALLAAAHSAGLPIALSYVDETAGSQVANRVLSIHDVRRLIRIQFSNVVEYEVSGQTYSQLNQVKKKADQRSGREILFVGS